MPNVTEGWRRAPACSSMQDSLHTRPKVCLGVFGFGACHAPHVWQQCEPRRDETRRGEAAQAARSVPCSKICKSNRTTMPGPTSPPLTAAGDAEDAEAAEAAEAAEDAGHAEGLGSAGDARRCEVRLYCSRRLKKLEAETSDIARDSQAQAGAGRARALLVACRPSPANFCRT
jgi:hypothetical protein